MKKFHHTFRGTIFSVLPFKRLMLLGLFIAFYAALSGLEIVPSQATLEAIPPTVEQTQDAEATDPTLCDDVAQFSGRMARMV